MDQYLEADKSQKGYSPFFYLEKGKSLYGLNQFEEALTYFDKVIIAKDIHHPFDLSIFYEKDAYAALCHLALGNKELAEKAIEQAMKNISVMPEFPYKKFIMGTYEEIMK